jgi:lipopolysaccharide export LptBFGC system permease protein LptF
MTARQRNIMIKIKKNCRFEYKLSYKAVSKGSSKKEYIRILKCLEHTHLIHINSFSFKIHETGTVEYQTFIKQARKYRVDNISYLESQILLEQEHQRLILNQKTYYNLLRKNPANASNFNIITALLKKLNKAEFVYKTRIEDEIDINDRVIKRKMIQIMFFHKEIICFA